MSYIDPAGKLLAHIDRLADLKDGGTPSPINIEIDLSNRCSLGCEWCHFAYTHTRGPLAGKRGKPSGAISGGDLMDTDLAMAILDDLGGIGGISVTWTGGGESTLHPDFNLIVSYAAQRGIRQGIYTHGGHITQERAALLKEHFDFVYVSLDAADAESYKRAKGVDRFDTVCANIRRLVAASGDATIGVGYLVTETNWEAAGDAAGLAYALGADYVQFRPTIHYEQADPDHPAENTEWLAAAIPHLERVAAAFSIVEVDLDRFNAYRDWAGHGYETCWWSALQTVITPNGFVWTCVNKREHPASLLGELAEEPFEDIWARRPLAKVDGSCRVMCRGHIPNLTLTDLMAEKRHAAFV